MPMMMMMMVHMDQSVYENWTRHYSTTTTTTISTWPRAPLPLDATNRCELQYCSWNDGGASSAAAAADAAADWTV